MNLSTWEILLDSLWDWDGEVPYQIPGPNLPEWLGVIEHDYEDVDRIYVDAETIGGA